MTHTLTTILKSDPTGNIFFGDRKVVQLEVEDEARGTEGMGRGFLLPPMLHLFFMCVCVGSEGVYIHLKGLLREGFPICFRFK